MAKAKYLADVDNNKIYPVGHTRAVYDENGTLLEDRLTSDEQKIATEATERKNADNTKVNISGGDVSKTVVSFTQSSTRTDITSGDTVSTLFGKIKKWLSPFRQRQMKSQKKHLLTFCILSHIITTDNMRNISHIVSKTYICKR